MSSDNQALELAQHTDQDHTLNLFHLAVDDLSNRDASQPLKALYQIRDAAFFNYLRSVKEAQDDASSLKIEQTVFLSDDPLISTLVKLAPAIQQKNAALKTIERLIGEKIDLQQCIDDIEEKIAAQIKLQRSWIQFFIESLPHFILNLLHYRSVQAQIAAQIKILSEQYKTEMESLDEINNRLTKTCKETDGIYSLELKLKEVFVNLSDAMNALDDEQITGAYQAYLDAPTTHSLLDCYILICRKEYLDSTINDRYSVISSALEQLHPDFKDTLNQHRSRILTELGLLEDVLNAISNNSSNGIYRNYLRFLHEKYKQFLETNSEHNFTQLYQLITQDLYYRQNPLLKDLLSCLEKYHPQQVKQHLGEPVTPINEQDAASLLAKYKANEERNKTNLALLKCLSCPTWKNVFALETSMRNKPDYYQNKATKCLVDEFMALCTVHNPILNQEVQTEVETIADEEIHFQALDMPSYEEDKTVRSLTDTIIAADINDDYQATIQLTSSLIKLNTEEDPDIKEVSSAIAQMRHDSFFKYEYAVKLRKYQLIYDSETKLTNYNHFVVIPTASDHKRTMMSKLDHLEDYARRQEELQEAVLKSPKDRHWSLLDFLCSPAVSFSCFVVYLLTITKPMQDRTRFQQEQELKNELYAKWKATYPSQTSELAQLEETRLKLAKQFQCIEAYIKSNPCPALQARWNHFLTHRSESSLIDFYQQLCVSHYYDKTNAIFDSVFASLDDLYPDKKDVLTQAKEKITHTLMSNDQLYHLSKKMKSAPGAMMQSLSDKLRLFLNDKSEYHFVVLYQQLTGYDAYKTSDEAMDVLKILTDLYPDISDRYVSMEGDRLPNINTRACYELRCDFGAYSSAHPVFTAIQLFLQEPNWINFSKLNVELSKHLDYVHDPILAKMVCLVMHKCIEGPFNYAKLDLGLFSMSTADKRNLEIIRKYLNDPEDKIRMAIDTSVRRLNVKLEQIGDDSLPWITIRSIKGLFDEYCDILEQNPLPSYEEERVLYAEYKTKLDPVLRHLQFRAEENSVELADSIAGLNLYLAKLEQYPVKGMIHKLLHIIVNTNEYQAYQLNLAKVTCTP